MLKSKVDVEDLNPQETAEWLEALDQIVDEEGPDRATQLLDSLLDRAATLGVNPPLKLNTPYLNTIPVPEQVPYPGDRALERRIKSLTRWNAMAMVVRANKYDPGIGGHISTYASLATLVEVGFNHIFRGSYGDQPGDLIYFQGHASPGIYARAFLEGRLTEKHLENFRHELRDTPGLSSYPHPWLMPDFWQFPTVSMGLGPINSIYQARFMRYLENRGIIPKTGRKIWTFVGDGESDEPESLGALTLASREKLDNLVFVVNCNLQRLDGPVRGNGNIVQELEAAFRGAGWNVIKVIWGDSWDELLERDTTGLLVKRMGECVDGEFQNFAAKGGAYTRKEFFGKYPELLELVSGMTDEQLGKLRRGGHDPVKVLNAFKRAVEHKGGPTVILAKTIKGYGMGEAGEGRNITHQQKKLNEQEMEYFRRRFEIPIPDEAVHTISFYRPADDSPEIKYLQERRRAMGGNVPERKPKPIEIEAPPLESFQEQLDGSAGREVSTTMAFVRVMTTLLKDPKLGRYVVPIIPDEARTFGMESLFRQIGIYASQGQLYKPVDRDMLLYYREAKDGQILEEGITEAGSMASLTAAGTAYANYGVPMIPFFTYYSMFGFQRIGDMVWAFADSRGKGFMMGGTAGRTTLSGEGLQHQDGHSLVLASTVPTCASYDPSFAYEIAVIVQDGIRRMYQLNEDRFYYLTIGNENYAQPAMPQRPGMHRRHPQGHLPLPGSDRPVRPRRNCSAAVPILNEALRAQQILHEKLPAWRPTCGASPATTSCAATRFRWSAGTVCIPPSRSARRSCWTALKDADGPIVAASDYMKVVPDQVAPWLPGRPGVARDRRLRPQRQSPAPAPLLRGECRVCGCRRAVETGSRGQVRRGQGAAGDYRPGARPRVGRSGAPLGFRL